MDTELTVFEVFVLALWVVPGIASLVLLFMACRAQAAESDELDKEEEYYDREEARYRKEFHDKGIHWND